MLKNILKLNGAQELSKKEQNSINGGNFIFTNISCTSIFDCISQGADRCYFGPYFNGTGRCVIF